MLLESAPLMCGSMLWLTRRQANATLIINDASSTPPAEKQRVLARAPMHHLVPDGPGHDGLWVEFRCDAGFLNQSQHFCLCGLQSGQLRRELWHLNLGEPERRHQCRGSHQDGRVVESDYSWTRFKDGRAYPDSQPARPALVRPCDSLVRLRFAHQHRVEQ